MSSPERPGTSPTPPAEGPQVHAPDHPLDNQDYQDFRMNQDETAEVRQFTWSVGQADFRHVPIWQGQLVRGQTAAGCTGQAELHATKPHDFEEGSRREEAGWEAP